MKWKAEAKRKLKEEREHKKGVREEKAKTAVGVARTLKETQIDVAKAKAKIQKPFDKNLFVAAQIAGISPEKVRKGGLTEDEATKIADAYKEKFGTVINIGNLQKKSDIILQRSKALKDYSDRLKTDQPITPAQKEAIRKSVAGVEASIIRDPRAKDIKASISYFNEAAKSVGKNYIYLDREVPTSTFGISHKKRKLQKVPLPVVNGKQVYWEDIVETAGKYNQTYEEVLKNMGVLN